MSVRAVPYPGEILIVPRRKTTTRGRAVVTILAAIALAVLVLNVLPQHAAAPAPAARQHATHAAAARPTPKPAVLKVTAGTVTYACTVVTPKRRR